jgi:ribosome modulation factor
MKVSPFLIDSKYFAIILSTLYLLTSNSVNTYSYGVEYPQNTQSYMFGYTAALHNESEAICNYQAPDCVDGYEAGLAILHPPAESYNVGYKAGLNNQTLQEACPSTPFKIGIDYATCSQGFDAGRLATEIPTIEYKTGWNWGKSDAILFLFDGSQCKVFNKNINNDKFKMCIDAYQKAFAAYVYANQPGANSVIEAYHQTLPYKMGYALGTASNKNVTALCEIFSGVNRDYTTCIKGWIDGSTERFNGLSPQKKVLPYD